jgi:ABC-2 type transport system ATP-binding protein
MNDVALTLETHRLTKRFGHRTAIADLDLAVPSGLTFGLLGHNGAGKTTLVRLLLGLIQPDAGTVTINGRRMPDHRRSALAGIGAIVEEPHFHGHLTGRENLRVVAAVRGPHTGSRIEPALARVGLRERADDRVRNYSQGMRQRLGIARCLLADPHLLILDEPTNGLDPGGILQLRRLIADLVAEGRTVVLSSHLLGEIEKTCQAVAVLDQGRLVWQGGIDDLVGESGQYDIDCDRPGVAVNVLQAEPAVVRVDPRPSGVRVRVADPSAVSLVNARLIAAGVAVSGVSPVRISLEERFLEMTTRIGGPRP